MARRFPEAPRSYTGLCIGGPAHGLKVECEEPKFEHEDPGGFTRLVTNAPGKSVREFRRVSYIYRPATVYADAEGLWGVEVPAHWAIVRMPFSEIAAYAITLAQIPPPTQLWVLRMKWDRSPNKKPIGGLVEAPGWSYRLKV